MLQIMRSSLIVALLLAVVACDDETGGDGDSDSDVDVDGDGDGDGDGDVDADVDADGGRLCTGDPTGDGDVHGTLVAWHPIEVRFEGPTATELDDDPNPFLDYRLVVTFVGPAGQRYEVPGFFAGDGEGGGEGSTWSVRFSPDQGGEWTYEASFRAGDDVAIDLDTSSGTAAAFDGAEGWLCVDRADPSASGFLGQGRLDYVGGHYLRLSDGTYWIKGGADSPENFLGYVGFDNTVDQPGGVSTEGLPDGLHTYAPHIGDWTEGDPDWGDGAGRAIIGALNYLGSQGVNSIYFLPCNLEGDGRETYPYVSPDDLLHLDISKLHQWEIVLDHAQRQGIALHVVLAETEDGNEGLHDDGQLGTERMLFYRELIARFGHHLALFWNIGEENDYGPDRQRQFAGYIRDVDPYDHPITVHSHIDRPADQYAPLVGDPRFELTSIQLSPDRAGEFTETWRSESAAAGRPWAVMLDEIGPAGTGVSDTNAAEIRRITLWPALLSGAGGVEWYLGYHPLPLGGDMRCEDFRTREEMWRFTRNAIQFMQDNLPFWNMAPADELLAGEAGDGEVFALPGEVYAVYLPDASSTGSLDLSGATGELEQRWFDPRAGVFAGATRTVTGGANVTLGAPPSDPGEDWVVLLRRTGEATGPTVTGLVLVNAATDVDIGPLSDGDTIDLGALGTSELNVRAETTPAVVGSVRFGLDGDASYQLENTAPYALAGDTSGDYAGWTPAAGDHTLTATAFDGADATGEAGPTVTVGFTVR